MKLFTAVAYFVALIWIKQASSSVWSPEDREIFALRDAVEHDIGPGTTFYSWLGISRSADDAEITRAYRKLSRQLHPDKNPSDIATERFARLGVVANVLRSARRDRYDFFIKHGFPQLSGSDYRYKRYRPGIVSVLIFLYLLIGGGQYVALRITASRHKAHMESVIEEIRYNAWGNGVSSTKRKVTGSNGKTFVIYPTGSVFLVENDVEFWLNPDDIHYPQWKDTVIVKFPKWVISKVTGYKFQDIGDGHVLGDEEEENGGQERENGDQEKKERIKKPVSTQKVGGMRRKKA